MTVTPDNMNTTIPVKTGSGTSAVYSWRTDQNNNGAGSATFEAYAVCGHAAGYKIVIGTPVSNPPSSQTQAVVTCPSPKVALSGGGFSSSANPAVDLNSSGPISTNWEVYENNPTTGTPTIAAYAVCAGT